jgi:hypothetical protein
MKPDSVTKNEICRHGKIGPWTFARYWRKWGLHKMRTDKGKTKPYEFDRTRVNIALLHEGIFQTPI